MELPTSKILISGVIIFTSREEQFSHQSQLFAESNLFEVLATNHLCRKAGAQRPSPRLLGARSVSQTG